MSTNEIVQFPYFYCDDVKCALYLLLKLINVMLLMQKKFKLIIIETILINLIALLQYIGPKLLLLCRNMFQYQLNIR